MGKTPKEPRVRVKGWWALAAAWRVERMQGGMSGGMLPRNFRVRWMPSGLTHRMPVRPRDLRVSVKFARVCLTLGGRSMAMKVRMGPVIVA